MRTAAVVLAVVLAAVGCAPPHPPGATDKERFDNWFATSGVVVKHQPVPCPPAPGLQCGSSGGYEVATKTIYLDDAQIAVMQQAQNAIDPSVNAALQTEYHEKSHAAFFLAGEHMNQNPGDPGTAQIWWEREANCGMRLLVGGWHQPGTNPDIYWICPDAKVAETRWIWGSHGII